MSIPYLLLYLSVFLTSISQVFLKLSAIESVSEKKTPPLKNPKLYLGYGLLVFSLILNIIGLRTVPLSHMAFILPITYVLVPVLSWAILKEKVSEKYWLGVMFISLGVAISGLAR